eukprot:GHVH01007378.1.p1 GENE.GHVH01007378.1~~GHVH01007378.1.p1  ORF type:complete len:253 (+),score=37.05 GHVH01007378.1:92-850(+)
MGSGYDLSVSTFSPDGRVFQVEYAQKAIDTSGTSLAFVCKDGLIFGVEKFKSNNRLERGTNTRLHRVDEHAGICIGGLPADGVQLVQRAREESQQYSNIWKNKIPGHVLADRMGLFVHAYTLGWSVRPFGSSLFCGVKSDHQELPELYSINPSGACYRYIGVAVGKGRQVAKVEMEKLNLSELTCDDALIEIARILLLSHEESKDQMMEIEIATMKKDDNYAFKPVPFAKIDEVELTANEIIAAMEDSDSDE